MRPAHYLGRGLWKSGDGALIDGSGPTASPRRRATWRAGPSRLQTGYLYHYAFAMLIGVAGLVTWYLVSHSRRRARGHERFSLLTLVTFLPLVGAGFILAFIRGEEETVAPQRRWWRLWTSLITFLPVAVLWFDFDRGTADFQFVEKQVDWLAGFGISYHMGVDGISMLFVLLSTLLTPLCVLASWRRSPTGSRNT